MYIWRILYIYVLYAVIEPTTTYSQQRKNFYDPRLRQFHEPAPAPSYYLQGPQTQQQRQEQQQQLASFGRPFRSEPLPRHKNGANNSDFLSHATQHIHNFYHTPVYYLPLKSPAPAELAKYRQEGNYHTAKPYEVHEQQGYDKIQQQQQQKQQQQQQPSLAQFYRNDRVKPEHATEFQLGAPAVLFENKVYHYEPVKPVFYQSEPHNYDYRQRRYTNTSTEKAIPLNKKLNLITSSATLNDNRSKLLPPIPHTTLSAPVAAGAAASTDATKEIRSFHDIYMRYAGPQDVAFGHVAARPDLFEQRFEKQNKGNTYKGDVIWADKTGGYGMQHWNLAQGKL